MSTMKNLSVCLVVVCFTAAASSPVLAELVDNGRFEDITAGTFDSWSYTPATTGGQVAVPSLTPTVIEGTSSAMMLHGSTAGGRLWQQVSPTDLSNFRWELDFAILPFSSGSRSLSILTFWQPDVLSSTHNVDSVRVNAQNHIEFYNSSTPWVDTGLIANTTVDINNDQAFDDGETPVVNHLEFLGLGYGTPNQSLTITLNGNTYPSSGTTSGTVNNHAVKYFAFAGDICAADFLVDNVSFTAVPEPTSMVLLAGGLLGLLACAWRKRK